MVHVDKITVTPNPVDTGKTFIISVEIRETNSGAKRYPYKYPCRYKGKEEK